MKTVQNAFSLPEMYYGRHFSAGVAEYREPGKEMYRILVRENTAKKMDQTYAGRPLYVGHVPSVDLENIQKEADGYVVESFFNEIDGSHWVQFIVVSDRAKWAIKSGWQLSNAYVPTEFAGHGGMSKGVDYHKEITNGVYEHLSLVPDPRYEDSVILTAAQFKEYNANPEKFPKFMNSKSRNGGSAVPPPPPPKHPPPNVHDLDRGKERYSSDAKKANTRYSFYETSTRSKRYSSNGDPNDGD